jgi:hypothetical protein
MRMRPLTKGLLLGTIGAAAATAFYARFVERARVRLDRFTVRWTSQASRRRG